MLTLALVALSAYFHSDASLMQSLFRRYFCALTGEEPGSMESWSVSAGGWGIDGENANIRLQRRAADPVKYDVGFNRGQWRAKTLGTLLKGKAY